ncbi:MULTISPECIES: TIGR03758 family integrating conjugative element protein [unclassified Pseudomonas]|jgi:integrating conjugative element protein (TIGR03758 family)|uniref:TIGR03758 family integrating conjugative element protein n=1 Tax=unclassified Pseudomonas TaxID=196821 RepID=UPI000761999F|nr:MULTISPECIES: TIGR03758 family integrating conjugative element protein [unclassified Pseudomonas]KYC16498.1 conjugal transfer protein [Pseudomonas sp. ABFPK]
MSMSGTQVAAFNAASGITPQASTVLFVGTVIALSTLWGAWALYSIYRGWATQNIDRNTAGAATVKVFVLLLILSALVLS